MPDRRRGRFDHGFTLIELLVVMSMIGVLTLLALPLLGDQRKRSVDAGVQSDLRKLAAQMEIYFSDTGGYPASLTMSGQQATLAPGFVTTTSAGNTFTLTVPARPGGTFTYCLVGTRAASASAASQDWVWINDKDGLQPRGTTACS